MVTAAPSTRSSSCVREEQSTLQTRRGGSQTHFNIGSFGMLARPVRTRSLLLPAHCQEPGAGQPHKPEPLVPRVFLPPLQDGTVLCPSLTHERPRNDGATVAMSAQ